MPMTSGFLFSSEHLASRGAAAAGCLRILVNTTGGLSHQNMKTLYNACVLPALSYTSPVWWNGNKGQIRKIESIQNRCIRTIMPVFATTPIHAMQVQSGVPPLQIRLNHMEYRAAAQLAVGIDPSNPIYEQLPDRPQREHCKRSAAPPPLPVNPTRKPGMLNKFKESTVHETTKGIPRNIENITPAHTTPPWRTDAQDKRYATRLTTNPARRGLTKGEAADEHRTRITQLSQDADYVIIYTDGSTKEKDQESRSGTGWVLYWKGTERRNGSEGMGKHANVYDAEMLALLRGLETAIEFQLAMPKENRKQSRIILFADNTSSVASIINEKPGSSQHISQKFMETATNFLNKNRRASIEVSWVPGHMKIAGNDRADEIAKEATELEPATTTTTIAKLHRQLRDHMKVEWVTEWARTLMTGRYP